MLNLVIDNMTTDQRPQTAFLGTRIIEGWEKRVSRARYFKRGIQTICWCKIRWHSNPSFETKSCDPKTWQIAFDGDLQIAINRIPSNLLVEKLLADKSKEERNCQVSNVISIINIRTFSDQMSFFKSKAMIILKITINFLDHQKFDLLNFHIRGVEHRKTG